jgi:Carboxypeptidase regulatory-like domain
MKALVIAAACLLLATLSSGECVEVTSAKLELPTFQASSRRVRITTLQDGKALGNVRVLFYLQTDEVNPRLTLTTDKQGVILARALPLGHYRILAIGPEHESAEVYLEVSDQSDKQTNSFLVTIPSTFFPEKKSDIDAAPVTQHIREFKGRVGDPSGAFVPGALLRVFRKSSPTEPVVKIKTDNEGAFAALLVPGIYVAFVSSPGFFKQIVGFEIGPSGEAKDLRVELRVGFC